MNDGAGLRIGILGAGRSRNGSGPFLARAFHDCGAELVGVAGRNLSRAQQAAAELGEQLQRPVAAFGSTQELCAARLSALVIASPDESHLLALQAALAAGVAVFCEKPVVAASQCAQGIEVLARFADRGLLVAEHVQWPKALLALEQLHGPGPTGRPQRLAMGLGPTAPGSLSMLESSLPHLISVAHALRGGDAMQVEAARCAPFDPGAEECRAVLVLGGPAGRMEAELHLRLCPEQPRPAWIAVDGRRIDRRIGPGYRIQFEGGGGIADIGDPMRLVVQDFVSALQRPPEAAQARRAVGGIQVRLAAYRDALALCAEGPG